MKTKHSIVILGSGTSTGIPTLACPCKVCHSKNPKDKRYRTSFLMTTKSKKNILIDTTPDLRSQLLENNITKIDSTIITHEHADHLHGIDDLRPLCFFPALHSIDVFTSDICAKIMKERYPYIFQSEKFYTKDKPVIGGGIPRLKLNEIELSSKKIVRKKILGETFYFFLLPHGYGHSMGFVHESFAYVSDCNHISEEIISFLKKKKLSTLIMDCVQEKKHESHLSVSECFYYAEKIKAKKTGLIHMNHHLSHDYLLDLCKKRKKTLIEPLFDRQKLSYS